ncbi:MAG: CHAT domain-containing protein, partial [Rhodothermales bacterium]
MERDFPRYYDLKYNVSVASPKDVQKKVLNRDAALIEYVLGEREIFIFTITPTSFDVATVPKDSLLNKRIEDLRRGIVEKDFTLYTENAHALYEQLIAPVSESLRVRNLIIVPDGNLSYVPFEALLTSEVDPRRVKDYRTLPYLIDRFAISYAYSATLLLETQKRERTEPEKDYLAFAPVFAGGLPVGSRGRDLLEANGKAANQRSARSLGYLPMTRTEVTGILKLFKEQYGWFDRLFSGKAQVYLEEEAAETAVKNSDLSAYRYLHFATHSFANTENPEASGIVLYPDDFGSSDEAAGEKRGDIEDIGEDGVLRLGEVYNLELNADLVVLSACETGLGPVARGEGILSLTRGFLYAGASNVLVSLWSAEDVQTSTLMQSFYRHM